MGIYAVYKGDEFLVVGTVEECARYMNCSTKTIKWLASPSNIKKDKGNRLIAFKVEDEDEVTTHDNQTTNR